MDLHSRLLERLDYLALNTGGDGGAVDALRAVVELHRPVALTYWPGLVCGGGCKEPGAQPRPDPLGSDSMWLVPAGWPCKTIEVIASKLGIEVERDG